MTREATVLARTSRRAALGRLRARSPRQQALLLVAVVAVLDLLTYGLVLVGQAFIGEEPIDWISPLGPVLGSLLGTCIAWSLIGWWRQRRAGEPERERLRPIRTATRTGRLPADVDPAVWAPLLAREQRAHRRRMVVVAAVQAALSIVLLTLIVGLAGAGLGSSLLWAPCASS